MDTTTKTGTLVEAEELLRARTHSPLVPLPLEVRGPEPNRQTPAVGQRTTRPDARTHGLGQTKYIDDFYVPGMLYAKIKRAGVASARILKVDTSEAEAMPGVVAVSTSVSANAGRKALPIRVAAAGRESCIGPSPERNRPERSLV